MIKINSFPWQIFFAVVVFLFGVLICHYTGNRGIYPIDSFSHFDSGYRILNGEHPLRDYWVVSGLFVDYVQSIIFYLFGLSWQTYILNASALNGLVSVIFYSLLNKLGLNYLNSFFYAICFSILAYPSSGTPFVDHHSTLLSMMALMMFIYAVKTSKQIFWVLMPFFLFFAFLSKQVPATYILFTLIFLILFHFMYQKKGEIFKTLIILLLTSVVLLSCLFLFFKIIGIDKESFFSQYLFYPSFVGSERYENISYNFKNIFLDFKFIHLSILFFVFLTFLNLKNKKFYEDINFKILLLCVLTFLSLAQHIIFTKNQIFIFFLIPFILGFANIQLNNVDLKYRKYLNFCLIVFCIGITLKYHQRFNVERKFHELSSVKFDRAVNPIEINKKFSGLKWISPKSINKKFEISEIEFIKRFRNILLKDEDNKIVLTNYSIFSVLIEKNIGGYSRWYTRDGSAFPISKNKFAQNYKDLIISVIKRKKIKYIYILPDVSEKHLINYLDPRCFNKIDIELKIKKYEINNKCDDLFLWKNN